MIFPFQAPDEPFTRNSQARSTVCTSQIRLGQVRFKSGQFRFGQVQIRLRQIKFKSGQVRFGQVRSGKLSVCTSQIRSGSNQVRPG